MLNWEGYACKQLLEKYPIEEVERDLLEFVKAARAALGPSLIEVRVSTSQHCLVSSVCLTTIFTLSPEQSLSGGRVFIVCFQCSLR